jgi:hypothetical protein
MWWARLLGGRTVEADDEPARFAPPESAQTRLPVKRVQGNVSGAKAGSKPTKSGFDPYNSGAFERSRTWERVIRR